MGKGQARTTSKKKWLVLIGLVAVAVVLAVWLLGDRGPVMDEAMAAGKTPADFPHADNDFFRDMDGGVSMTPEEIRGRNTWMVWTGGNEAFWDYLASHSFGSFDLLKTISSFPCSPDQQRQLNERLAKDPALRARLPDFGMFQREGRFRYLGLMNEPGFRRPNGPDELGLCLDEPDRPPDFDEAVYGRASGVLGLRLYPNPRFDEAARARWNESQIRYYTDPAYYSDSRLVRPYRVGMSCAFCHVSPDPIRPPGDPENPAFRNLSGTIGAQYWWVGRVLAPNLKPDNFVWHLLNSSQPGTVDTSFIPTDYINNPRAINAVFDIPARAAAAARFHEEEMAGGALDLPEVQERGERFSVPHILWDGADSVGIDAALTRVYINIGEYHEQWIRHIQPLIGGRRQTPIRVDAAQQYSTYWNATQERAGDLASYLIKAGAPMRLEDAPGGEEALLGDRTPEEYESTLTRGKVVFAENCARCHSSKLPEPAPGLDEGAACSGERYLECWDRYWQWTETDEFKQPMREMVLAEDFLDDNYLSTDARIPVTLLETEICSAMASNAVEGYVWDNFSSASYKSLPDVGTVTLQDPISGESFEWETPGGGRGYQRVPSLISIWATAPFLHNNEIGRFTNDPSVEGRLEAFDDAIRKLLWLTPRDHIVRTTGPVKTSAEGYYGRTYGTETYDGTSWLSVYVSALPPRLQYFLGDGLIARSLRWVAGAGALVSDGLIEIGPIPAGTPVNLLANLNVDRNNPSFSAWQLLKLVDGVKRTLKRIEDEQLDQAQTTELLKALAPRFRDLSVCPDFVVDRGHDFGRDLSVADKEALIELLKTF